MRLRPPMTVPTLSLIASVFVMVLLGSGSTTAVGSMRHIESPQGNGGINRTLPVADRTVLSTQSSHHSSRHYKTARHSNKQAQQYYQPARQYYQWHEH